MYLIFLRHAKAEDDLSGFSDEGRPLTAKGRKKARDIARGLVHLLPGPAKVEIWSSPALRSSQTAAILTEVFENAALKETQAIYTGCLEDLVAEWRQADPDTVIIVVGHQPHLSIWSRQLADVTLHFKKCAAAGFTFDSPDLATLQWFADPKVLTQLGASKA